MGKLFVTIVREWLGGMECIESTFRVSIDIHGRIDSPPLQMLVSFCTYIQQIDILYLA